MTAVIITMRHPDQRVITRTFRVNGTRSTKTQADEYQKKRESDGATLVKRVEIQQ